MKLHADVLWTLNRLDAVQRNPGTGADAPMKSSHLEALEEAGYITVRACPSGGWHVHVLPEGQSAALYQRRYGAHMFRFRLQKEPA